MAGENVVISEQADELSFAELAEISGRYVGAEGKFDFVRCEVDETTGEIVRIPHGHEAKDAEVVCSDVDETDAPWLTHAVDDVNRLLGHIRYLTLKYVVPHQLQHEVSLISKDNQGLAGSGDDEIVPAELKRDRLIEIYEAHVSAPTNLEFEKFKGFETMGRVIKCDRVGDEVRTIGRAPYADTMKIEDGERVSRTRADILALLSHIALLEIRLRAYQESADTADPAIAEASAKIGGAVGAQVDRMAAELVAGEMSRVSSLPHWLNAVCDVASAAETIIGSGLKIESWAAACGLIVGTVGQFQASVFTPMKPSPRGSGAGWGPVPMNPDESRLSRLLLSNIAALSMLALAVCRDPDERTGDSTGTAIAPGDSESDNAPRVCYKCGRTVSYDCVCSAEPVPTAPDDPDRYARSPGSDAPGSMPEIVKPDTITMPEPINPDIELAEAKAVSANDDVRCAGCGFPLAQFGCTPTSCACF